MDIQITLNNGTMLTLRNAEIDPVKFTDTLNDRAVTFVNFNGTIVNKNLILSVVPIGVEKTDDI